MDTCPHTALIVEDHGRHFDVVCTDCGEVVEHNIHVYVKSAVADTPIPIPPTGTCKAL